MFISLIFKGGPIMIPIILGSVLALAIILEKLWTLWRVRLNIPKFTHEVFLLLRKGNIRDAVERCERVRHPIGDVFKAGIRNHALKRDEIEKIMEREGDEQIHYLERYLGALLILIGVEPMMGFLGTIVGLIRAFMAWEQMGSNITVNVLAAGIYQAMITTAAGLSVAIPAYIIYHLIVVGIKNHAQDMTYYGNELIGILTKIKPGAVR